MLMKELSGELHENSGAKNTERLIAFLAALCLFLSTIEYAVPKPLPFMRLGLANMPIIIALYVLKPKYVFFLILLKVFGQAFISGTFFSYIFVFSVTGSFAAGAVMFAVHKIGKNNISPIGISLAGSSANSAMQILLSYFMLFEDVIRYIAPILLINGIISGFLLGLFTNRFINTSKWFALICRQKKNPHKEEAHD